ncbi:MAG TPA: hypothetical protein VHZ25_13310 [Acidobacteriaceae bacterium]|jgi:hypothetical protein|nr:hypothetical protein [Acidobacteriaceae bacterium]
MAMVNQPSNVLTEELLAHAERLYVMALMKGAPRPRDYDEESGVSAEGTRDVSAEEKKWLT